MTYNTYIIYHIFVCKMEKFSSILKISDQEKKQDQELGDLNNKHRHNSKE
jgi:hypothetical protein